MSSSKSSTPAAVPASGTPVTNRNKTRHLSVPDLQSLPSVNIPAFNLASNSPVPSTSRNIAPGSVEKTPRSAGPKKNAKLTVGVLKRLVDSPVRNEPTIPVAHVDSPGSVHDASTDENSNGDMEDTGAQGNSSSVSCTTSTQRKTKRLSVPGSKRGRLSISMHTQTKKAYNKKKWQIVNEVGHFENGVWWCNLCDRKKGFHGKNDTMKLVDHAARECYENLKEMISKQNASHIFQMVEELLAASNIKDERMSNEAIEALINKNGSDFQTEFDRLKASTDLAMKKIQAERKKDKRRIQYLKYKMFLGLSFVLNATFYYQFKYTCLLLFGPLEI